MFRSALLLLSVALCGADAGAPPAKVGLDDLLRAFAAMPGLEAGFVEQKRMALLAAPLESSGRLYFTQPGLLTREVRRPSPSRVVITPDKLYARDATGKQMIDLRARPDVKLFVESFVRVLAGDRAGLEQIYEMRFTPGDPWTLRLVPRGPPISKLIRAMEVSGRGLAVESVSVEETNGDASVTRITDADPARRFSDAEKQRVFAP